MYKRQIITHIEFYKFNIPLQAPVTIAIGTIEEARNILVKIHTSDGVYGTGEGAPFWMIVGETQATVYAASLDLAKLLIGKNPLDLEGCIGAMERYLACLLYTSSKNNIETHWGTK